MPTAASTLAQALAKRSNDAFCYALLESTPAYDGLLFHERPDDIGLLGGLASLYLDVRAGGIRKFLGQHEGDGFTEARGWCARVGATQAVAYLDAVAALFPGGTVPRDGDKRDRILERLERRKGGDPLRRLDEEHRLSLEEMFGALRSHVKANRVALQTACATRPATPAPDRITLMSSALGELDALLEDMETEQLELKAKAETRGVRALDGTTDPRIIAFFGALAGLGTAEWTEIAKRAIKDSAKIAWGDSRASDVSLDLGRGNIIPKSTYTESVHGPAMAARDRFLAERVDALPEVVGRGANAVPLRRTVRQAIIKATIVLMVQDWLLATPQGPKAAANVLAPFQGFAPLLD